MIHCVPLHYGFAHVCDGCGAVGPIQGSFDKIVDMAETPLRCTYENDCSARLAGWSTSPERDLCPKCKDAQ